LSIGNCLLRQRDGLQDVFNPCVLYSGDTIIRKKRNYKRGNTKRWVKQQFDKAAAMADKNQAL